MEKPFHTPPAGPEAGNEGLLNPEQRRAVDHGEGPLAAIAGVGTGKTRAIVERIRRLVAKEPLQAQAQLLKGDCASKNGTL